VASKSYLEIQRRGEGKVAIGFEDIRTEAQPKGPNFWDTSALAGKGSKGMLLNMPKLMQRGGFSLRSEGKGGS